MTPKKIEALKAALPNDHVRALLTGGLEALETTNPIRMHSFAHAVREVFSQTLHALAPEADVRDCDWFVQDKTAKTLTRVQRARFAMQGGLSDDYVRGLGVNAKALNADLGNAIQKLNDATHVQAGKIETNPATIAAFADGVLKTLEALLKSFADCREIVRKALEKQVYAAIIHAFVENTIGDIDLVSSHGYEVDFVHMDSHAVVAISSGEIEIEVEGSVETTLHYGRGDDAAEIPHAWPFTMTLAAPVGDPKDVSMKNVEIDESGWYGDAK